MGRKGEREVFKGGGMYVIQPKVKRGKVRGWGDEGGGPPLKICRHLSENLLSRNQTLFIVTCIYLVIINLLMIFKYHLF